MPMASTVRSFLVVAREGAFGDRPVGLDLCSTQLKLRGLAARAKPVKDRNAKIEIGRVTAIPPARRRRINAVLKDEVELRFERRAGDLRFGLKAASLRIEAVEFEPAQKRGGIARRLILRRRRWLIEQIGNRQRLINILRPE